MHHLRAGLKLQAICFEASSIVRWRGEGGGVRRLQLVKFQSSAEI
jgi:hypothetical protein